MLSCIIAGHGAGLWNESLFMTYLQGFLPPEAMWCVEVSVHFLYNQEEMFTYPGPVASKTFSKWTSRVQCTVV